MPKKIICTTSKIDSGNTFLNWSIYYLTGSVNYLTINNNFESQWLKLCDNPLLESKNAHLFKKIHCKGSYGFDKCLEIINNQPDALYCLFPTLSENIDWSPHQKWHDFSRVINSFGKNNIHWIHNDSRKFFARYKKRGEHYLLKDGTVINDEIQAVIKNTEYYFSKSRKKFDKTNSGTREWLALHFDHILSIDDHKIDFTIPHLYIEETALWFDGEYVLQQVMDYCKLDIVAKQWIKWENIYRCWQKIHQERIRLPRNIHHVCQAIVHNWNHDLEQYNLDFLDEAYILHNLMKYYNINIKGSQLLVFPKNTKDFEGFLETTHFFRN